jgi:K+-sensing histidine kinase KdpD
MLSLNVLMISIGVMATGAGLLSFFIKKTTENLDTQYQISHLLRSILNHDIRNYVGSLSSSIDQAIASDEDREMWLELASEIITAMMDFVENMRYLTSTITRVEAEDTPMNLARILEGVSERVIREYNLKPERIVVEVDKDVHILTCGLVKEMFWNIFDNAFKHGTQNLTVRAIRKSEEDVIVQILDTAGGIPTEILDFLNHPQAFSSQSAPGVGLGIILIRSLAALCGIPMKVEDIVDDDEQVVGSLYQLQFKLKDSDILDD